MMSDTLRKIISDPEGNKELQRGISRLIDKNDCSNGSTEIFVGIEKYKIQFVQRNLKPFKNR